MSQKLQAMLNVIANPANLHRFRITIPDSELSAEFSCIVESTSFPAPGPMREIALWMDGEKVTYPGQPENGGTWQFKIPESDKFEIAPKLDALLTEVYNFETGLGQGIQRWRDVLIQSLNLNDEPVASVVLHGAWMKNRASVNLDASNPANAWKWEYTMYYNWVGKLGK